MSAEYVPQEDWKTLNALDGFGTNSVPASDGLAGITLDVEYAGGPSRRYEFVSGDHLRWKGADGCAGENGYVAREVLDGVFLVDFTPADAPERAVVLVVDRPRAVVTTVISTLDLSRPIAVSEQVLHGVMGGARAGACHPRTDALTGHRVRYVYDEDHVYEHIYLDANSYCWHCLKGPEAGQADVDPTVAFEIRPDVYLLCWREHVVPCDGIVVLDWVNMRNNGRIWGWDTDARAYNSIRMGARAERVSPPVMGA